MGYEELIDLAESYPAAREDLVDLSTGYQRRNEGEILELAALAVDLSASDILNLSREPEPDLQVMEAFRLQYPNVELDSLAGRDDGSIEGFVAGVKGKYFEVLVRDRLNAGDTVGELQLEAGHVARLALKSNEPGWDLEVVDRNGGMVEQLKLKAHQNMSGIYEALNEHDFRVVVPEHLDSTSEEIIGTDVALQQITENTKEQLSEFSEGAIRNAVDVAAETVEPAWDIVPLGSVLVIGVTEGRRYLMGRATLQDSMRGVGRRSARAITYNTLGTALGATGLGIVSIPIVMGARVAESRITGAIDLADNLATRTEDLNVLEFAP